ncbi:MAG: ABC transporter ATP-binding protein [bacterium]|nr:ABC transporter ATP-binding protein [bacterium]
MHLEEIDLCLEPGSFTVLLGATNAGKTSLLRVIAGLDAPTSGSVRLEDAGGEPVVPPRDALAMVYQEFVNYPSLTVFENIAAPLRARGQYKKDELERRVRAAAERFELDGLLERLPAELSGGQQQRTALARAMIKEADVVLLDEPLANLDYKLREGLRNEIAATFDRQSTTVVYASTDPVEALWFGHRTAVLHEGRLLQQGEARAVYDAPADECVARAVSDPPMNVWTAHSSEGDELAVLAGLVLPCPTHLSGLSTGAVRLGLRAHRLRLEPRDVFDVSIPSELELAEVTGSETTLHVRNGSTRFLGQVEGVHRIERATPLDLFFDPADLFAFDAGGGLLAAPHSRGDD